MARRRLVAPRFRPHLSPDPVAALRRDHELHKLTAYLPAILWAALALSIGSLHRVPAPSVGFPIDKVGHFGLYGVLGVLTARGWLRNGRASHFMLPLLLALSVGGIDEIHQRSVAGRSSEAADFAADTAGIILGFFIVTRFRETQRTGNE